MVIGIIAVIAVVLAGVGIKNVATSVPDYEKPLKYEIDGINKNNTKTYKKAFLNEEAPTSDKPKINIQNINMKLKRHKKIIGV